MSHEGLSELNISESTLRIFHQNRIFLIFTQNDDFLLLSGCVVSVQFSGTNVRIIIVRCAIIQLRTLFNCQRLTGRVVCRLLNHVLKYRKLFEREPREVGLNVSLRSSWKSNYNWNVHELYLLTRYIDSLNILYINQIF